MNETYPQPIAAVNCFSARRLYELIFAVAAIWFIKALEFLTAYGKISTARMPEEFVAVRVRLQQEWIFNAGFVS